jgi:PIN domain nuclease of toxin-antitoxin system
MGALPGRPIPRAVLLDTCAALWIMSKAQISDTSTSAILEARRSNSGIYVSPFLAWEVGTLVAKGRIQLTQSPEVWIDSLLATPGVRLAPLTPQILLSSTKLPGTPPKNPADRIVAATARTHGYFVITRDVPLLQYAEMGHMHAIAC